MVKKLKQYFPPVCERNIILSEIGRKKELEDGSIANLEMQQKYMFIPLDIFRKSQHNKEEDRRNAWLTFFSEDDPEHLAGFIEKYPEFREMYDEAYMICRTP